MSGSPPRTAIHKPLDDVGRTRLYFTEPVSLETFVAGGRFLENDLQCSGATRWSARALVTDPVDATEIRRRLNVGGPVEINRLPSTVDGRDLKYLWVSRTTADRLPGPGTRALFAATVDRSLDYQHSLATRFDAETDAVLTRAAKAGLTVVCNDPFGEWGDGTVDADTFARLIGEAFFVDELTAREMLAGRGYSHLWHYLFALRDAAGEVMCVFVVARWPWGFEATYTIVNSGYRGRPVAGVGAARLLMFVANALVLSRHGAGTLVYGEANAANCRPCVQAGYEIHRPGLGTDDPLVHEFVVWADNPIGAPGAQARAPHHAESEYVSYAVLSLNPRNVAPHVRPATALLRP